VARSRRRDLAAAAGALTGVLGAACGRSSPGAAPAAPAAPASSGPVRVVYISPSGSGPRFDLETQLFDDFNAGRPKGDVIVEVSAGPSGSAPVREKFVVAAAGGQPFGLVQNNWGGWMDLAQGGSIAELSPYFKRDRIDPRLFLPEMINEYSDEGRIWALPVSMSVDALAYNMDLFDRAGLKYPPTDPEDKSWTMERFLEHARLLSKPPDQFGFGGGISGGDFGGMTEGTHFGQGPWDDARKRSLFASAGMRKGMQFWLDVALKHRVQPTAEEANALRGGASSGNVFLTGKVGMQVFYTQTDRLPFRWGLATLPYSGPAGSKNISGRAFAHALHMGQVKEKEAVWEVLKWLTRPENGGRFVVTAGHATSPIVKGGSDIAQQAYKDRAGVDARAWVLMAQQVKAEAWGMFKYPNWTQVEAELRAPFADLRAGKIPVDEYAERAAKLIDERLIGKRG